MRPYKRLTIICEMISLFSLAICLFLHYFVICDESDFWINVSFPEVTGIRENADGTVTLTVDAVCEMVLCNEAVITHELTVKFDADGSFHYLGNKILNDGINDIPAYEYRLNGNEPAFSSLTVP